MIFLLLATAMAGHYPVPDEAKIHKHYFEGSKFHNEYNITCHLDDRLQFWWNHKTKKRRHEEGTWFIANNTDKMKLYMEYQDTKQTDERGLRGDAYESLNKRALMDSIDLIAELDKDNHLELRHEDDDNFEKKPY